MGNAAEDLGTDEYTGVLLPGGTANRGLIRRVADTVRRPLRATSASTHDLLDYLDERGFDASPRFLGIDEAGREILSFVDGEAPTEPYPDWALTDEALASVAELLRRFHEAVKGFPAHAYRWQREVPPRFRSDTISHNDPNLDNIIFRGDDAVALIDFDLAGPGSPVWDLALTARLWCPLRNDSDINDSRRGRTLDRLALLLDAYGASPAERGCIVEAIIDSHDWCYQLVRAQVVNRHPAFTQHWLTDGAAQRARRTTHWYKTHLTDLREAALG
jgi:hypothetical protein